MVQGQAVADIIDWEHKRHRSDHIVPPIWCSQARASLAGLWAESEENIFNFCLTSGDKFNVLNHNAGPTPWYNQAIFTKQ